MGISYWGAPPPSTSSSDGQPVTTRDGKHITAVDFVDATQENIERIQRGKTSKSIISFSGFGPGTLKKSYE